MKQTVKPSRRLLRWVAGLAAFGLVLDSVRTAGYPVSGTFVSLYWGAMAALSGIALLDALRLRSLSSPRLQRHLPGSLSLGRWIEVWLEVEHDCRASTTIQFFDHCPDQLETEHLPQRVTLTPGVTARLGYRARPLRRGALSLDRCEIHVPSALGLWTSRRYLSVQDEVRVYPDFARMYGGNLLAVDNLLGQIGIRQQPRRGLGLEFNQLREFREGDSLRQIDWKATARQRTPIAREYQDERDQQIIFLLDCGRRMRGQDGDLSHFDHALNACLLLSHIALRQGDAVGLSSFAADEDRHIAPAKGRGQLHRLLNMVYDLESTRRPADYAKAVRELLARQKKRALVVVVTNLRDEEDDELLGAMKRASGHHRVLIASLREEVLDKARHSSVQAYDDALQYCGVVRMLGDRSRLQERLTAQGVPILDARPEELGSQLVTRYLSWKKAGSL